MPEAGPLLYRSMTWDADTSRLADTALMSVEVLSSLDYASRPDFTARIVQKHFACR
jgi:hypothetical protein